MCKSLTTIENESFAALVASFLNHFTDFRPFFKKTRLGHEERAP